MSMKIRKYFHTKMKKESGVIQPAPVPKSIYISYVKYNITMSYRMEKFSLAILDMASKDGSVQERLMLAIASNNILGLDDHFDDDLRDDYMALKNELLRGSIKEMTSFEAFSIIDKIISIYSEICRRGE